MNSSYSTVNFYPQFSKWLDSALSDDLPEGILGFAINLCDGVDSWGAELIGTPTFDEKDEDWACEHIFISIRLEFPHTSVSDGWEGALSDVTESVRVYLSTVSVGASKLLAATGIGVGFVDGNMVLVHGAAT